MVQGEIVLETKSKKFNVLVTFFTLYLSFGFLKFKLRKVLWNLNDRVKGSFSVGNVAECRSATLLKFKSFAGIF